MKTTPFASSESGPVDQALLELAIRWAVQLGSGQADSKAMTACEAWRAAHPSHEQAWLQVQAIEDAFLGLPSIGAGETSLAHDALKAATRMRGRSGRRSLVLLGLVVADAALQTCGWREHFWL